MSTLDRQQRRAQRQTQRAASLQAPFSGQTSEFGDIVNREIEGEAPPVRDVPLGPQGVRGPDFKPGEPDDAYDVPFDMEAWQRSLEQQRSGRYLPAMDNVDDALFLADAVPSMKPGDDRQRAMLQLERFEEKFPGRLAEASKRREIDAWEADMLDKTPQPSSFEISQMRRRLGPSGDIQFAPRRTVDDLPADSWERVVREAEKEGLDTTSGYGDNIWEVAHAAMQFDAPHVRNMFMEVAVRSNLMDAGVELPKDYNVIRKHPDLGTLMYLKPTEEGKVRWTLADPQVMSLKDWGLIADPSDLLSAIGAGVGTVATGNKFTGELVGDFFGRNLGMLAEALISRNMLKEGDVIKAFGWNAAESLGETVVSRSAGRAWNRLTRGPSVTVRGEEVTGDVRQHIDDTADMMETIEAITGRSLQLTPAEASGSATALRRQRSKEQNLSTEKQMALADVRDINTEILRDANEKAMGPHDPLAMEKNAYQAVEELPVYKKQAAEKKNGEIITRRRTYDESNADIEYIDLSFTEDMPVASKWAGDFEQGVRLEVDRTLERVVLTDAFAGAKSQGNTVALLDRAWREAQEIGYDMYSGNSISPSAQKMMKRLEDAGWRFELVDPSVTKTAPNGNLYTETDQPVYRVVGAPGDVTLTTPFKNDGFDKLAMESELATYEEMLPAAQQWANEAQDNLLSVIGWSNQTRRSGYFVENDARTGLRTQIRAIQNRFDQALTGVEAQGANRLLRQAIRTATDEEGDQFLSGLAADQLDLGNLIRARDAMADVAAKTKDPDAIRLVQTIDNLLKNGKVKTNKGRAVSASKRAKMNEQMGKVADAQDAVHEAASAVNVGIIFKKNADGEYINTTPQQWRSLLKGRSFLTNLAPVVGNSAGLRSESARVLRGLYREEVFKDGKWSRAAHDKFMDDYDESIRHVFDEQDVAALQEYDLQGGAGQLWEKMVNKARYRAERAAYMAGQQRAARGPGGPDPINISPQSIIESMNSQNWLQVQDYIQWVKRTDPKHYEALQEQAREQIQRKLRHDVFSGDELSRSQSKKLTAWYEDNGRAMRTLLGEEYYQQLGAIVRGVDSTTAIKSVNAPAEESLKTYIKWVRTLFGVLTRPQRQLTAAEWTRTRLSAAAAVNMLSSPEAVRMINVATHKGLDPRSQAGVALLTRLGFFSDMGIVGDPSDPEYQAQVAGYFNDLENMVREAVE